MSLSAFPDPEVTPELVAQHGLTPDEFDRICSILGRKPNFTELGIFSVMWSEHCSYKNSKAELRKFPTSGPHVLVRAGEENAGVLDIGNGWAVAFKVESHNHPSAVEPFQGAATGVGGIIRDIFTMGARPLFLLNSLRFGPIEGNSPTAHNNRRLLAGVVAGIAHYGNCVGLPTLGGEIYFDDSYSGNPLVNVFCLGILRHDQLAKAAASGTGNPVFYVGSETGRDGLAGAAFASRELSDSSHEDRPAVQVGDPFREKLLLEACLELLATGAVAGIQDMGAAGLTCSTCETASRANAGIQIDLALVPQREPNLSPYEILLSESQERMLVIVHKGHEQTVRQIFEKWQLPYAQIGHVTSDGLMRVLYKNHTVAEIPARSLANDAPVYHRTAAPKPTPTPLPHDQIPPADPSSALPALLADPSLASKRWVFRQYDHEILLGSLLRPGHDAAVFLHRESDTILAASADCNSTYCLLDPYAGASIAVAESLRNLACTGALPIGITDNLNFGNPYKPEIFLQLREAIHGIADTCKFFNIPVTGGNVSLYNESPSGPIDPTPTICSVGIIRSPHHLTPSAFQNPGDLLFLLGPIANRNCPSLGFGGSHYLKRLFHLKKGTPPLLDLQAELRLHNLLRNLASIQCCSSAHDCSEGGLALAIAESWLLMPDHPPCGVQIQLPDIFPPHIALFNEAQSRAIVSVRPEKKDYLLLNANQAGVPILEIGQTLPNSDTLSISIGSKTFSWQRHQLASAYFNSLPSLMQNY